MIMKEIESVRTYLNPVLEQFEKNNPVFVRLVGNLKGHAVAGASVLDPVYRQALRAEAALAVRGRAWNWSAAGRRGRRLG